MSSDEGIQTPLPPSLFARLASAARFVIAGVAPETWFGPQQPLAPMAPQEVKGRQFDYPFGANINYTPRSDSAISFAELRALADALPLLRAVIETRKDQVAALDFSIRSRDPSAGASAAQRAKAVLAFLDRPDRRHSFAAWLRMLLEDMLVIDAATLYPRLTRAGALYSLDIVDGSTIKPLIGEDGRSPEPPDPAYQQVLHGVPAADFSSDELLYLPRNARAHRLYGMSPVEARDQSQIELYGPRVGSTITAHEICDVSIVASVVAQTILQRALYIRAHFTFKLSWLYCLLDPMDIVEITDANLGLSNYAVRITAIEEDDKGVLTVTAEELTVGVSTPALYRTRRAHSTLPNHGAAADPVNPPLIYEPPAPLSGGASQLWVGASGGSNGAADPNWGGAYVWASLDNATYDQVGTINQPAKQGVLTAALPKATGYDTADTLAVNLGESGGDLASGTEAQALAGATLCLVGNELLAYATATLTSANNYNLTGLARGLYGTTPTHHASGASFTRLNQAIVKQDLAAAYIGQTIYLKFQSFNVFGAGVEELSACAAYPYTPAGTGVADPIAAQLESGVPLDLGFVNVAPSLADDFGTAAGAAAIAIDLGVLVADPIAQQILSGFALDLGSVATAPTIYDDFGLVTGSVVDHMDLGVA